MIAAGCATAKTDWDAVWKQDTPCSYEEFIRTHPSSEFAASAKARMEQMEWEASSRQNTIEALQSFLREYPGSRFASRADEKIESLAWEEARSENTPGAYRAFLMDHPQGKFAQEAREELDWETARTRDTTDAYLEFLSYHEAGRHAEDAKGSIEGLAWRAANKQDTAESYQAYLSRYPEGRFAGSAKKALELKQKLAGCKAVSRVMGLQIDREMSRFIGVEDGSSLISGAVDFRVSRIGLSESGAAVDLTDYVSAATNGSITTSHFVSVAGSRAELPGDGVWYPAHQIVSHQTVIQPGSTIMLRDGRQFLYGDGKWHQCMP